MPGRSSFGYLASNEPRIQAACYGSIVRAFDDGSTIGKEGHFKRIAPKLENESVVLHRAMGAETG